MFKLCPQQPEPPLSPSSTNLGHSLGAALSLASTLSLTPDLLTMHHSLESLHGLGTPISNIVATVTSLKHSLHCAIPMVSGSLISLTGNLSFQTYHLLGSPLPSPQMLTLPQAAPPLSSLCLRPTCSHWPPLLAPPTSTCATPNPH